MAELIDPTIEPGGLSRAAFVTISAAASAGAATGVAVAQSVDLGKPHPPRFAEQDPAIRTDTVTLKRPDTALPAYVAMPAHGGANTPSVVVIMHIWGVDSQIRDTVRRLAEAGYAAIAPYLYHRTGNDPSDNDGNSDINAFRPFAQKLDRTTYDGDIRAAALHLKSQLASTKTGILGFCMGGRIVLEQAADNADVFAAAAPFYGSPKGINALDVKVPVVGSYGERDQSIPAGDVRLFQQQLRVPNDIKIYPTAGHAFFDDTRASYVPAAAEDAWARTMAFFGHYLGSGS